MGLHEQKDFKQEKKEMSKKLFPSLNMKIAACVLVRNGVDYFETNIDTVLKSFTPFVNPIFLLLKMIAQMV